MKPEDVPTEWVEKAAEEIVGSWDGNYVFMPTAREMARDVLAAVLPEVRVQGAWIDCQHECGHEHEEGYHQRAPEPTYRVTGGQGGMDLGRGLTYADAVALRDDFNEKSARYGLENPPTRITKEGS